MWKWFKEKVLGIKPIFKIKIETSCFSEIWFCVKFSNNNGWTWEYILKEDWKIPSPCNEWEVAIKYFQADDIGYIKEKFNTYEACIAYNENTFKRINEHNKNKREKYESDTNKIKSFNEK
jgi:hypothetical protein